MWCVVCVVCCVFILTPSPCIYRREPRPLPPGTAIRSHWGDATWRLRDGGAMGRRPTSLVGQAHVGPNRPLLWWVDDMWVRHSREECMPSFLLIHGCHVGPLILVLASDWSRGFCLRLLMWHCAWAGSPPLVWLPYGPFWPLGSPMSDWAFVPWIIIASFLSF